MVRSTLAVSEEASCFVMWQHISIERCAGAGFLLELVVKLSPASEPWCHLRTLVHTVAFSLACGPRGQLPRSTCLLEHMQKTN